MKCTMYTIVEKYYVRKTYTTTKSLNIIFYKELYQKGYYARHLEKMQIRKTINNYFFPNVRYLLSVSDDCLLLEKVGRRRMSGRTFVSGWTRTFLQVMTSLVRVGHRSRISRFSGGRLLLNETKQIIKK